MDARSPAEYPAGKRGPPADVEHEACRLLDGLCAGHHGKDGGPVGGVGMTVSQDVYYEVLDTLDRHRAWHCFELVDLCLSAPYAETKIQRQARICRAIGHSVERWREKNGYAPYIYDDDGARFVIDRKED
jgi:hypothetical protein